MPLYTGARRVVEREESIYNLVPKPATRVVKAPRYTSTFRPQVKEEVKARQIPRKTMGPAAVDQPSSQDFLRKHSKEFRKEEMAASRKASESTVLRSYGSTTTKGSTKVAVPRHTERPAMGVRTTKDFIRDNAVKAITSVPAKPVEKIVDMPSGATQVLTGAKTDSGLRPRYVNKEDYGKTPYYIQDRKKAEAAAQEEFDMFLLEQKKAGDINNVKEKEREEVLDGLKKHWEELHRQYLGLSVVIDTLPKKIRKERIESQMKQLENDIQTIEHYKSIYVMPTGTRAM